MNNTKNTNNQEKKTWLHAFFRACFKLIKLEKLYDKYEEIIMYVFIGVLTTLVSILTKFLGFAVIVDKGQPWRTTAVVIFSWIAAVTFAFFTNKSFVFNAKTETREEFFKVFVSFYSARLATLGMEWLMFFICCDLIGISETIITIISQFVIFIANYLLSKLVFKK